LFVVPPEEDVWSAERRRFELHLSNRRGLFAGYIVQQDSSWMLPALSQRGQRIGHRTSANIVRGFSFGGL
jgi:hypothetical protein